MVVAEVPWCHYCDPEFWDPFRLEGDTGAHQAIESRSNSAAAKKARNA